jgi:leucyl aminopeptidase
MKDHGTTNNHWASVKMALELGSLKVQFKQGPWQDPQVCVISPAIDESFLERQLKLEPEAIQLLEKQKKPVVRVPWAKGRLWIVRPALVEHFAKSEFAQAREAVGMVLPALEEQSIPAARIHFEGISEDGIRGAWVGLGLAQYRFRRTFQKQVSCPQWLATGTGERASSGLLDAEHIAKSVNLCRHLTNLPANYLNPESFAGIVKSLFRGQAGVQIEIWNAARLRREKMGLHLAVGQGAEVPPALVRIQYRPRSSTMSPIALVGKGITFDSGGLDLKPASGMRWMKKDMGGAAAVLGALHWAVRSKLSRPISAYLALAENAVDERSFRPGDVLTARSGLQIEIQNTDAEGRLVLADALSLAKDEKGKTAPVAIIDVATLTGASKVALGADVAGLYSNDDSLASHLEVAAENMGDPAWRMPLYQKYKGQLHSTFADFANSSDGFGGAITAALFLQQFVGDSPWAHFDIYAWKDAPEGGQIEMGGSGQAVQLLIGYLRNG